MTGSVGLNPSYQAEMGPALEIRRSGVAKTRPNIMQYNPLLRYRSGQSSALPGDAGSWFVVFETWSSTQSPSVCSVVYAGEEQ